MVGLDPTTQALHTSNEFATLFRSNSKALAKLLSLGGRVKPDHGEIVKSHIN
jgi:hypothetical protein